MVQQQSIDDVIEQNFQLTIIDVRTPNEFDHFHIPGAINIPLFSNEERVEVGTIYKQRSPQVAIDRGLEIVAPKLPSLYQQIKSLYEKDRDIVIYCWRGGMRSRSLVQFMDMMGIPCKQLIGGIRSFRKRISSDIEMIAQKKNPFVIVEGLTGTRKTDILLKLQEEGYPVIDLEGLANHRGSIFGSVGKAKKSQKTFERDLWLRLMELKEADYYLIEGESRRLGRIMVPDFIIEGKEKGLRLVTQYPLEKRVEAIFNEYDPAHHENELHQAFYLLKRYLPDNLFDQIEEAFQNGDHRTVILLLLEDYYDLKYQHSHTSNEGERKTVHFETLEEGLAKIKHHLHIFTQSAKGKKIG